MKMDLSVFKNQPKISKKDLTMLEILGVVIIVCALVALLMIPNIKSYNENKDNYGNLESQVKVAETEYKLKASYEKNIKSVEEKIKTLSASLPQYLSQEDIILTLGKYAKDSGLKINAIDFEQAKEMKLDDLLNGKAFGSEVGQQNSQASANASTSSNQTSSAANLNTNSSSNASSTSTPNPSISTNGGVLTAEGIKLTYSGTYDSLYKFLKYVESNLTKVCTTGIIVNSPVKSDSFTGTISLLYLSYREKDDKGEYKLETPQIKGKTNPFSTGAGDLSGKTDDNSKVLADAGQAFVIMLNTFRDNAPKVIMNTYPRVETQVSEDKNGTVKGNFTISGSKGSYSYSYTIGTNTFKESGDLKLQDGKIIVKVISQPRVSGDDKVALNMDIQNNSDVSVVIDAPESDAKNPRFILGKTNGKVILNR